MTQNGSAPLLHSIPPWVLVRRKSNDGSKHSKEANYFMCILKG